MTNRFVIGLIGAPFGLKGHVKVRPFSGEIDHLLKLESVTVRQAEKERTLRIEECVAQTPGALIKFAGFDSPEAAKALHGAELLVSREQAAPLEPGEFYVEDLRGLAVVAAASESSVPAGEIPDMKPIGHITDIIEGGGGELAEIKLTSGEVKLVPFRKEFFAEISPEKGRVVLVNQWVLE
jgi:16S rRNA processing protein RimM